jgi:AcrR family transcriptional regulator
MPMQKEKRRDSQKLLEGCLAAFVRAGTIDLSLDQLASSVGISKRMLIHYFGGREEIEEGAMTLLEERLRQQFAPEAFAPSASLAMVVAALWKQTTAAESRGVLLLVMDLSRLAWSGSSRAKAFYAEQQRLWVQLLMKFLPSRPLVEQLLQLFQGAVLAYLITGDPEPGKRSLTRFLSDKKMYDASADRRGRQ